jgi:hypothetical protein
VKPEKKIFFKRTYATHSRHKKEENIASAVAYIYNPS